VPRSPADGDVVRVLVADDQSVVRAGLRTLLDAEPGLSVVGEVDDGAAVPGAVALHDPDVVLMDVRMPHVDGIEATARLRRSGARARVCVLTTYAVDDYVYGALAAGASGFLLKTDTPERIAATVRAVAAGEFALGTETTRHLVARYLDQGPRTPPPPALATLTTREREVFDLVAQGLPNAEVARRLGIGEGTAKTHVAHVLLKLGLRDRVQVVVFAHQHDLV
jgi:DNA-binding NarL/FixJ family response regulator